MFNQAIHLPVKPVFLPRAGAMTSEEKAVDRDFRRYYVERNLFAARVAFGTAFWLIAGVSLLDMRLMPEVVSEQIFGLRMWTMLVPLLAALGGTVLVK